MPEPTDPVEPAESGEPDLTQMAPQGRPLAPDGNGPPPASAVPTMMGPPPPAAAPPPYVPPPVAPPRYPQPGQYGQQCPPQYPPQAPYGQPPTSGGGSGRTIAVAVAVVVALAVLVGGGLTALLLAGSDDEPDGSDAAADPSGSSSSSGSSSPSEDVSASLDPDQVDADLVAVATDLFPSGATLSPVLAHSWSVEPGNLAADQPRDLVGPDRLGATQWEVRSTSGDHSYWVYVEHVAPDYEAVRTPPACDVSSTDFCEVLTTPSGQTAYEQVYTYDGGGTHYVWIPGDAATGRPDISIGESVNGLDDDPDAEVLIGLSDLSVDAQLAVLDDPRLQVRLPEVLPALPSFSACAYTATPPTTCPAGLQ
ncbi:hypothetical protein ASE01_04615 [Nocardioides sp. Root190]|uniref:hypothetical protein n=1 Tax=Nocardioides sp. Root190 TaxID=1736488 RepID=UPI0006FF8317|nr:hypothetical protein [Nocardioides sp. Root190]KRB78546.1 hypothetical protein ASE01_04615 [Nocardioides sp. Root190]